ncbi:cellulase family glycosylhydrolase [Microbacter margulisiae]|uniref:Aryl-phospho-beta-D-glucosidase BglC (GH1 family) n=1 Tax=Microbacter margulisiae TaxID=1350067 RepID=A0A7W5DSY9_9PORP|nr:cellulase family glycosylhydrolase [Microbacter margulisiae]MBB3188489.1 aryl-phospho-beta-D-glucosidase BglC (GH1 family) [Microbacter margulisiae]
MKFTKQLTLASVLALGLTSLTGCQKNNQNILLVNHDQLTMPQDGGSETIALQTDAGSWNIVNPGSSWLTLSSSSGTDKNPTITMTVNTKTTTTRADTLIISAGSATPVKVIVTQLSSAYLYNLTADKTSLAFTQTGNTDTISIASEASQWNISSKATWLQFSQSTGSKGNTTIEVTASQYTGTGSRTDTITISAQDAPTIKIPVTQNGPLYPDYNTSPLPPDATGMSLDAQQLAAKMTLGLNIWNTLEAIGGETAWGNPQVTQAFIDAVKNSGFNAIRIPCSWDQYANQTTAKIQDAWLQRVKQVVQYCINDNMYAILNIHWDGGWLEDHCDPADQAAVNAKQKAFWQQIATTMRDFDEHLIFASANEPSVSNATQMKVLLSYHQTFINAVRSTGGKNSYRVLIVQGPSTSFELTPQLMTQMPTDVVPNRLMVEVHEYEPSQFTILTQDASWGKVFYYWGKNYHSTTDPSHNATWGEESYIDSTFQLMKKAFVDKGIPVVIGEFGATDHSNVASDPTMARNSFVHYLGFIAHEAHTYGMIPLLWSGVFNRQTNTVNDQQALDSLLVGVGKSIP